MEFNLLDFVQHILNIVVLYIILRAILYKPVRAFMDKRKAEEENKQIEIDRALNEAGELVKENERQLNEAQSRSQQLIDEKLAHADAVSEETVQQARAKAREIIETANTQIAEEWRKAQEELVDQTAEMAVELASRILQREVNADDNRKIIDEYFREVV